MKVALFIHSLRGGGAERVTALLANHWATEGMEISVFTVRPAESGEHLLSSKVKRFSLNFHRSSPNPIDGMWNNQKEILMLRRIIMQEKPVVAISMMVSSTINLSLAALFTSTVVIGSERNYPPYSAQDKVWDLLRRVFYRLPSTIVCQTVDGAGWIRRHTWARRVDIIPNPICLPIPNLLGEITPSDVIELNPTKKVLLCVGRLAKQKRFDRAIAAFAALAERHPTWQLVVLGEGPERHKLEELGRSLRLDGRLFMPGAVGNMSDWYQACDLFALTSDYEGFPNVLLEAMAHGMASVAYDCKTGPRDLIEHEHNGLLIPAGREDLFIQALDRCMSDPDLRTRLGSSARAVSEVYSLERVSNLWKKLMPNRRAN